MAFKRVIDLPTIDTVTGAEYLLIENNEGTYKVPASDVGGTGTTETILEKLKGVANNPTRIGAEHLPVVLDFDGIEVTNSEGNILIPDNPASRIFTQKSGIPYIDDGLVSKQILTNPATHQEFRVTRNFNVSNAAALTDYEYELCRFKIPAAQIVSGNILNLAMVCSFCGNCPNVTVAASLITRPLNGSYAARKGIITVVGAGNVYNSGSGVIQMQVLETEGDIYIIPLGFENSFIGNMGLTLAAGTFTPQSSVVSSIFANGSTDPEPNVVCTLGNETDIEYGVFINLGIGAKTPIEFPNVLTIDGVFTLVMGEMTVL